MSKLLYVVNVDWYFNLHWLDRARYFMNKGYDVHLATYFSSAKLKQKFQSIGINCQDIPFKRKSLNPFNEIKTILSIKQTARTIKPDLIHCITIKANIYAGLFTSSTPMIYSITGTGSVFSSKRLPFVLVNPLCKKLYKVIGKQSSSHFIFENQYDCDLFTSFRIINDNASVIKGAGVDLNVFKPSELPQTHTILFAARLLKAKGLFTLIDAVKQLEYQGQPLTLLVAGICDNDAFDAISTQYLEHLDKKGTLRWLGNVKDMPSLISQSDIVCLPTQYGEGVPRILIEAAACGRPIVATDVAGCRDIVEHKKNGFLVPTKESQSLAEALKTLLNNNGLCSKFSKFGRKKAVSEFSNEVVFSSTERVYKQLLSDHLNYTQSIEDI